jgi:hypothetical protein
MLNAGLARRDRLAAEETALTLKEVQAFELLHREGA